MYAVIMAGGSGTRLWPVSRQQNPKQLHALVSEKPMIQETVERLLPVADPQNMWVITNEGYVDRIRPYLSDAPSDHVVGEPFALGTTLAIGLAMLKVKQVDPQGTAIVAWSDSHISRSDDFIAALRLAEKVAQQANGVIVGVRPTFPSTGYGYIHMGDAVQDLDGEEAYWIEKFVEKPNLEDAEKYVESGQYLWNPGIAVWRVDKLLALFEELRPEEYAALMRLEPYLGTPQEAEAIARELRDTPKLAIDYTIHEKAPRLAVIPADLGWSDIGTWDALMDVLPFNDETNVVHGADVITQETENCLIHGGERLIATLGVRDLVIVDTGDCVLVAHRSRSQDVKAIVERLKAEGKTHYL